MVTAEPDTRKKLLDAALFVIRAKGFAASSVEDICREAGMTKGAFFHHFKSKEELAVAAAQYFYEAGGAIFQTASYLELPTARERVLGYVEFRMAILSDELPQMTCLLGTMVQEIYETHPAIREVCDLYIRKHLSPIEADLAQALEECDADVDITAESLGFYMQAVIQGGFVLAKAQQSSQVAYESLAHLYRYLEHVLTPRATSETAPRFSDTGS